MGFKSSKDETESTARRTGKLRTIKQYKDEDPGQKDAEEEKYLDTYGTNLIVKAKEGKIDVLLGETGKLKE